MYHKNIHKTRKQAGGFFTPILAGVCWSLARSGHVPSWAQTSPWTTSWRAAASAVLWETSDGLDGREVECIWETCVGSDHIDMWLDPLCVSVMISRRLQHADCTLLHHWGSKRLKFLWMTLTGGTWVCHRGLFLKLLSAARLCKAESLLEPMTPMPSVSAAQPNFNFRQQEPPAARFRKELLKSRLNS